MRSLPLIVQLVAFGVVTEVLAAPSVAWAQPAAVFEGTGLADLVSPTGIVGDGVTTADLYVLALGASGAPLTGLALKPSVTTGAVSAMTDAGGGLWKITYTPPKADARVSATLTLKGKIGKDTFQKSFDFTVSAPRGHQLAAAANPPKMILGSDRTANLSFNLAGGDRQNLHEKIRVHSHAAADRVKLGEPNDLPRRLEEDPAFAGICGRMASLLDPRQYAGLAPRQARDFLARHVAPALDRHRDVPDQRGEVKV